MKRFVDADIATAIRILQSRYRDQFQAAQKEIEHAVGRPIGDSTLSHAFACRGLQKPISYCKERSIADRFAAAGVAVRPARPVDRAAPDIGDGGGVNVKVDAGALDAKEQVDGDRFEPLLKATRKPIDFARLCDVLDLSPANTRRLVNDARTAGYSVQVAGDSVGWQEPEPTSHEHGIVAQVTGGRTTIGVISDTHFGSKYVLRDKLQDFIRLAYDAGARIILHAGDILDGIYDHGRWELSHHGLQEQIADCLATLPKLEGLRYCFIDGNHDSTFWRLTGYPTGRAIVDAAERVGRTDLEYVGARGALLRVGNVRVELWHPKKGTSYALSYHLQNHIRDMALGHKPDILLAGHWHTNVYVEQRGVHSFACGTFQGAGSEFSKSLGGAPSIGGWILSWQTTEHGTLRRLQQERISYYEQEQPRQVA